MKHFRSKMLSALQDGDLDSLKEMLEKDLDLETKSFKAILGKRHGRGVGRRRQRLILISAIEEENLDKVKNLLSDGGVNCNDVQENLRYVRRKERLYALHKATLLGLTDIVEVLLDAGANSNVFDQNGNTPLHIAVNQGSTSMVQLLLSCGADPKLTDRRGNAAIHIATSQGHLNLVRTLIEFRADVHQMNSIGHQPVHIAAAAGHFHIIHLLCSSDPRNAMARDSAGQCPLHLAAENGHVETVTALLDLFGVDPNEKNSEGEVPLVRLLHKPYRKNVMRDMVYYYATFMALVQYGASLDVKSCRGLTLLEIAEASQYTKIAESIKTVKGAANAGQQKNLDTDTCNAKLPSTTNQVTVSKYFARNEQLLNSAASAMVNRKSVQQPSSIQPQQVAKDSLANEYQDVTNLSQQKQVVVSDDEAKSALVPLAKDNGKASETRTGTVCLVKLEPARPDHYVIQTLGPSITSSNSSRSRLHGRTEVDSYVKFCAELAAFDKDIGISDEDFSEDFLSDTDSLENLDCLSNKDTTSVEKQDGKLLKNRENCKLTQDFTVGELISYFEDDTKRKSFEYEDSRKTSISSKESKNGTVSEKQKAIPTMFLCDNLHGPGQNKDKEMGRPTGQLLTGVDTAVDGLQASDGKQVVRANVSHDGEIVSEFSHSENEVQDAKVRCSTTGLHFLPLENADLVNSQTVEEPAGKPSEAGYLLIEMQSESDFQVNRGYLTLNGLVVKRDNKFLCGDERLLSSAKSPPLRSGEEPAEANVRSWADLKSSIQQGQSVTCTDFVSDEGPCNVKPKYIKEKLKKKKKTNKKPQVNEDLEITDCTKGSEDFSTDDARRNETVRLSNGADLAATEIEAVDCYSVQSLNCSTTEEHLNDISFHSYVSASDLGLKMAKCKKKKKKKKTKEGDGELVLSKSMETTFDDEPAFEFIQHLAAQPVCNSQEKFVAQTDGWSSKDVTKKKKKKTPKVTEEIEFTNVGDGNDVLSKNCEGLFVEKTERNWRTNLDEAPVVMHLLDESGQEQVDRFDVSNSANNDNSILLKTEMTNSRARKIRSELCSAFGILQDTDFENDLTEDSLRKRAGKRGSRIKDARQNTPDSYQNKSFLVQASKETCVDDDFNEGDAVDRIRDMPSEIQAANDCNYKETDVDEIFDSDDQQFNPEEEKDLHESDQIHVEGYDDADNMSTVTWGTNDVKLSPPHSSSVGSRSNRVKKHTKKEKSKKPLDMCENHILENVDAAAEDFSEPKLLQIPESTNKSPEPHFNGLSDDKLMLIDVRIKSNDNLDAAGAEYHRDNEEQKLETVLKDAVETRSDRRVPVAHSPVVSEESRTESEDDESDSSDNSSGEFVFGQSRKLFTIQELNAEAEIGVEDDQPDEMVDDEGTYLTRWGEPAADDWDDFELSELHTRQHLEKVKLTALTGEIRRHFYEAETDEEDETTTTAKSECLNEIPTLIIKSPPPIQPFSASPSTQPFSAFPPIQPGFTESPSTQPISESPSIQPFSASPPIQHCTTSPSLEPSTVASDVVSSILGQGSVNPVHVGDVLLIVQKPIVRDTVKVVKVRQSEKKKKKTNSVRSFVETSFDDMEPVSFEVGTSSEKTMDINVHNNFSDRTTVPENSIENPAINPELSTKFRISRNKSCVEQKCFQSSSVSSDGLELRHEPVKEPKHLQRDSEMELSELPSVLQDSLNDRKYILQTITKSKHAPEEQEEEEEEGALNHESEDLGDVDVTVSQLRKDRLVKNVRFLKGKEVTPEVQTKESVERDLVSENVEKAENEKLLMDGNNDELDSSGSFSRQQTSRVSKSRQKKGTKRPIRVTTVDRKALVSASHPTNDAVFFDLVSEESYCDMKNTENVDAKTEVTSLSSSSERVDSFSKESEQNSRKLTSKESEQNSRKLASKSASEVTVVRKKQTTGKPPLPRAVERVASAEHSNQSSPDIRHNTFHTLHSADTELVQRISHPLQDIKDDKILPSAPEVQGGIVQQQRMGRERTLPVSVRGLSSSFEEKTMSDLRNPPLQSPDRRSLFEMPRSADGISNMQLIPQHPVLSHPSQRQMRRRPGSQRVLTSEDLRRHQMNKAEPRLEPIAVQPPQKTLQEAAFESIFAASILNQSRSQPGRRVRPDNDPVTYCQGVYKPQQVVFRGSLSAGSGFDDSRTSADMGYHPSSGSRTSADIGYHPSSGSGNESWYGNE